MAMTTGGGDGGYQSEINVTPLVDVVLVLLIIFMVIVPLTMHSYDLDIPGEAPAGAPAEQVAELIVLNIDDAHCPVFDVPEADGLPGGCRVQVDDRTVDVAELSPAVAEIFAARAPDDRVLFLSVDERLNYEAVMRIVDAATSAVPGLRIGLVTPA